LPWSEEDQGEEAVFCGARERFTKNGVLTERRTRGLRNKERVERAVYNRYRIRFLRQGRGLQSF
jgi:hypothetical protein